MARRETDFRRAIAASARQVLARRLDFFDLVKQADGYQTGDDQVDKLIDLLEHEPAAEGWLGVGRQAHAKYVERIECIIMVLERER